VAGVVTTAGAVAFQENAPAEADAPVVRRLRDAGARIFAKTNMSEFAYSTHGINPHFGTPVNPWSAGDGPRIPGGSSSGAAVAVALGLGEAAIGTDTAGSARVPAALCGVVGFKPRQRRISNEGIVPLSTSYDCVGILARDVELVKRVFQVAADASTTSAATAHRPYRILWPTNLVDGSAAGLSHIVAEAMQEAETRLTGVGFDIVKAEVPLLTQAFDMIADGGLAAPEAFAYHRPWLEKFRNLYDPFTLHRLEYGSRCSPERYERLLVRRARLVEMAAHSFTGFDALVHPTCLTEAPLISDLDSIEAKVKANIGLMRATVIANVLDMPSISIPCHNPGSAPVGLSLTGIGSEEALLEIAVAAEQAFVSTKISHD